MKQKLLLFYEKNFKGTIWPLILVVVFAVFIFLNLLSITSYRVVDQSMEPTLRAGQIILVKRNFFRPLPLNEGDLIVYRNSNSYVIKRLFLNENSPIVMDNGFLFNHSGEAILLTPFTYQLLSNLTVMPHNQFFFVGDNRALSRDSRYYGFVSRQQIVGRVFFIFSPR
ncbi:MAG: signal peptidase I [Spirochaetaceae bacterium]|nr:signal peptidase I [Spirochaetaceae bacterium]